MGRLRKKRTWRTFENPPKVVTLIQLEFPTTTALLVKEVRPPRSRWVRLEKSKYYDENLFDGGHEDDQPEADNLRSSLSSLGKSAVDIVPYTDEEIKRDLRFNRHKCKLSEAVKGQITDGCKPGKAAELAVDKVKLHYVIHHIFR
jgi:hypothetical protein